MQNRRCELQNNYDDARLALLMDEFCEEEGAKLLAECDALNSDPNTAVPETLHRRLQKTVDGYLAEEERIRKKATVRRVFRQVLIIAAILAVLFTTAFATVEEFRVGVLNFTLKMQEKYSNLIFEISNEQSTQTMSKQEIISKDPVQFGGGRIVVDFDLNGFVVQNDIVDEVGVFVYLRTKDGNQTIIIESSEIVDGMDFRVDTEDADKILDIEVGQYTGYLIVKGNRNYIVWADSQNNMILELTTTGLSEEYSMELAESVLYIGKQ